MAKNHNLNLNANKYSVYYIDESNLMEEIITAEDKVSKFPIRFFKMVLTSDFSMVQL